MYDHPNFRHFIRIDIFLNGVVKDGYDKECRRLAKECGVKLECAHTLMAPVEPAITEITRELSVELLVMGFHGRTGMSALTLGNTAEQLLRHIECDLLSVQPRHHMTPLERELEQ